MKRIAKPELPPIRSVQELEVVVYGLGAIGVETAKLALQKPQLHLVAAVDTDPDKSGRDLGEVLQMGTQLGVMVKDSLGAALADTSAQALNRSGHEPSWFMAGSGQVAIHTTSSRLVAIYPQIAELAESGLNVVSSAEELSYPYLADAKLAKQIDILAKENEITVIGAGVNPGFVMDLLPLMLTGVCQEVHKVKATRVVDVGQRREALQKKVGVGMEPDQFEQEVEEGKMGHIGLVESAALVAEGLRWRLDRIEEVVEPVVADRDLTVGDLKVGKGQVRGVRQVTRGMVDGQEIITLNLQMYLGAEHPFDRVAISGKPDLALQVPGGIPGDLATAATLVNAIPRVVTARPGLLLATDLPLPRCLPGSS